MPHSAVAQRRQREHRCGTELAQRFVVQIRRRYGKRCRGAALALVQRNRRIGAVGCGTRIAVGGVGVAQVMRMLKGVRMGMFSRRADVQVAGLTLREMMVQRSAHKRRKQRRRPDNRQQRACKRSNPFRYHLARIIPLTANGVAKCVKIAVASAHSAHPINRIRYAHPTAIHRTYGRSSQHCPRIRYAAV